MHLIRRNLDCQFLLFNNEIYGLTKGQYSPTSRVGTRSPSTPFGSVDRPVRPCAFALGSGARFVARGIDVSKKLPEVLKAAHAHKGMAFVEIFQNCIVYNDDVFAPFTARENAATMQLWLEHGQPMLFDGGKKGIAIDRERLELVVTEDVSQALIHDVTNRSVAHMLIEMVGEGMPVALGVLYDDPRSTFESAVVAQNAKASAGKAHDLQALIAKGQTWQVEKQPHVI
jgi:2-oxoglutarate ferredoxin oxidoreductase subunit beta